MKNYGQIIAKLRKEKGFTQEQLGKKLNVSYQAVSKWENNLSEPDLATLEEIVNIFGITMAEFFALANQDNCAVQESSAISMPTSDVSNEQQIVKSNTGKKINFDLPKMLRTKPWYVVAGLGVLVAVFAFFAILIPTKLSSNTIYNQYSPAVFFISAQGYSSQKSGTGVFINNSGLAITVYDNIKDSNSAIVKLQNGEQYNVDKVVGVDFENNIAIIQVGINYSPSVKFGDSNSVALANKAYVITYKTSDKLDTAKSVLSDGLIYKVEYNDNGTSQIQSSASVSNINAGGALFDEYGNVVGIITGKLLVSGVGFDMVCVCAPINYYYNISHNKNVSLSQFNNNILEVKYVVNNNTNDVIKYEKVYKNETLQNKTIYKAGHIFEGWYADSALQQEFNFNKPITQDCIVYGKYQPITYTLKFNANGGVGQMSNQTFEYGVGQTISKCKFVKQGYYFAGWKSSLGEFNDEQQLFTLVSQHESIIELTAQWEVITEYLFIFDANGGKGTTNNFTVAKDTTAHLPACGFYREGYLFECWEYNQTTFSPGDSILNPSQNARRIVFKAIWKPITYTINFYDNNTLIKTLVCEYDQEYIMESYGLSKYGYDLLGWEWYGRLYELDESILNFTKENGREYDFKAKFTPWAYTITFNAGGGEGAMVAQQHTFGTSNTLPANTFTKTGYIFDGWQSDFGDFKDKASIFNLQGLTQNNQNITFTAKWTPIVYKIILANKHKAQSPTEYITLEEDFYYDVEYEIPQNPFVREGLTFKKWYMYRGDTEIGLAYIGETFKNLAKVNNAKIYLYASWENNRFTVSFDANGGEGYMEPIEYVWGWNAILPASTFTKEGYIHAGWQFGDKFFPEEGNVSYIVTSGEVTLKAVWLKDYTGEGTENSPYQISTVEEFNLLNQRITAIPEQAKKHYVLTADLDFQDKELISISTFSGVLDGGNHKLLNITYTNVSNYYLGLICNLETGGIIKNLGIENYKINSNNTQASAFAPLVRTMSAGCLVENCYAIGDINIELINAFAISGFVVYSNGIIKNCYSSGNILLKRTRTEDQFLSDYISGFVCGAYSSAEIYNCYSNINIKFLNEEIASSSLKADKIYSGLFAGQMSNCLVKNCFANGEIYLDKKLYYGFFAGLTNNLKEGSSYYVTDTSSIYDSVQQTYAYATDLNYALLKADLMSLDYLAVNLDFDALVWSNQNESFPKLKNFGVEQ